MKITQKQLDEVDAKILKYCSEGLTVKEIAYEMNLKSKHIGWRLSQMREYYKAKSTTHLIALTIPELVKDQ